MEEVEIDQGSHSPLLPYPSLSPLTPHPCSLDPAFLPGAAWEARSPWPTAGPLPPAPAAPWLYRPLPPSSWGGAWAPCLPPPMASRGRSTLPACPRGAWSGRDPPVLLVMGSGHLSLPLLQGHKLSGTWPGPLRPLLPAGREQPLSPQARPLPCLINIVDKI
jgi:hypothetical protein